MAVQTVVMVDMAGYSDKQRLIEALAGVKAAAGFDQDIKEFVRAALESALGDVTQNVFQEPGDGAALNFETANQALEFAAWMHNKVAERNKGEQDSSTHWAFRVGIATGSLEVNIATGNRSGSTISRANRLEKAAHPGGVLIDTETYNAASPAIRAAYRGPETILGKRSERFEGYRVHIDSDFAPRKNLQSDDQSLSAANVGPIKDDRDQKTSVSKSSESPRPTKLKSLDDLAFISAPQSEPPELILVETKL